MQFDLNKLMEDPNFISGIGLLGSSSKQTEPLLTAYQMLRQHSQAKQAGAFKQQQENRERLDSESQRTYRLAQAENQRATAAKYSEQVDIMRRKLEQGEENRKMFMNMLQNGGQQGAPAQPQVAPPPEPVGKYGTPKRLLQNLKQVESSGNPFAMGPDIGGGVRARGAFQFLPSTVDMLAKEGMKFDPFNPQQAEDAADFYIQKLVAKNGGDYQKALADYGGFKTKDSTNYVSKVLGGSPESVVKQHAQNKNNLDVQKQARTQFGYVPEFKLNGDNELEITAKPNYEQQRIDMHGEELGIKHGEFGLKQRESNRQDVELGLRQRDTARNELEANVKASTEQRVAAGAERERLAATAQDWRQFTTANTNLDMLSSKINELSNHPGLPRIYGTVGVFPDMPGSPAADARAKQTSVVKQIAKETLQSIRDASKTGGALGNVSDKDIELLEKAVQSLESAQSADAAKKAMKDVQHHSTRIRNIALETFERTHDKNPVEGLPKGARIAGTDPKTGKTFYRLPDGKFVMEK